MSAFDWRGTGPSLVVQCPGKSKVDCPNWHGLMISPSWLSRLKRVWKWDMCSGFAGDEDIVQTDEDKRQVRHCSLVKPMVVTTWAPPATGLWDNVEG